MNFLSKAKEILTERDLKLINVDDLTSTYKCLHKRIRMYRDEITYSRDVEFRKAKEHRIEMLKVICEELRMLK